MQKTIILFFILLIISCTFKKEAIGTENDLIVFISEEDKELATYLIDKYFEIIKKASDRHGYNFVHTSFVVPSIAPPSIIAIAPPGACSSAG